MASCKRCWIADSSRLPAALRFRVRPLLYETTQNFMDHFGLRNLGELPNAEELRRMPLPVAAAQIGAQPADPKQLSDDSSEVVGTENPAGFKKVQTEENPS